MPLLIKVYIFCFMSFHAFAFVSDGYHTTKDYLKLAQKKEVFKSACLIRDVQYGVQQTGVLIKSDIVLTAAHGLINRLKNKDHNKWVSAQGIDVIFTIDGVNHIYPASEIFIDSRYLENMQGINSKYDVGFVRLKRVVKDIPTAPLFEKAVIPLNAPLYVVTFSDFDIKDKIFFKNFLWHSTFSVHKGWPIKRAFMLCEKDYFYPTSFDDENLQWQHITLFSSLFFKPDEKIRTPRLNADEITFRVYEATQSWRLNNKGPYALALPGTSGAPVFITLETNKKQKDYLFGWVVAFSSIDGEAGLNANEILDMKKEDLYNNYQTIFAVPYTEDTKSKQKVFTIDPIFHSFLKANE
ncbi:MAG: hypothetical protein ACTSXG_01695 [Alphaproteobacteria bacterium]